MNVVLNQKNKCRITTRSDTPKLESTSKESVLVVICSVFLRVLRAIGKITAIFPVNMPDPIQKCLGYGQLWPFRPVCSQNRAGSYMSDPTFRIIFGSVLPEKARIILNKTGPDPMWMAWSRFWPMYLLRKPDGVQESWDRTHSEHRFAAPSSKLSQFSLGK